MAEGILERLVQHRSSNVDKGLHGRSAPAHLLFLVHALGHDLVDRALNERCRDRLSLSTPGRIMHQHVLVALKVAEKFADVSLKTVAAISRTCLRFVQRYRPSSLRRHPVQRPCHKRHFARSR
jgi:hypothetical protein